MKSKHPVLCTLPSWIIALLGFLCVLILGLTIATWWYPCESTPSPSPPNIELRFQVGTMIHLKIGGYGQIVRINYSTATYCVRVNTLNGPKIVCLKDYELEIKP